MGAIIDLGNSEPQSLHQALISAIRRHGVRNAIETPQRTALRQALPFADGLDVWGIFDRVCLLLPWLPSPRFAPKEKSKEYLGGNGEIEVD